MRVGSRRLFIYYRLDPRHLAAASEAVAGVQQALRTQHPGLIAELLIAPAAGPARTLMETYAMEAAIRADGIDDALQAAIVDGTSAALATWVAPADRHLEVFLTLCAS
jgi:hypothetical protein